MAWINVVRPDESRTHGADNNVVFLHFSSEAVKEAQCGMLGSSIWKRNQLEVGAGGPTLLPERSVGDRRPTHTFLQTQQEKARHHLALPCTSQMRAESPHEAVD